MFVWAFASLAAFTMVLVVLVVRRRGGLAATATWGTVMLVVLSAGVVFLFVPPQVPSRHDPALMTVCPYDRVVWSNMRSDVSDSWQPCRRAARFELASTLVGVAALTVLTARAVPRSRSSTRS